MRFLMVLEYSLQSYYPTLMSYDENPLKQLLAPTKGSTRIIIS